MSTGGLPARRLMIATEELKKLQAMDPWSTEFIEVSLELDNRWMRGKLRHRGGHTRTYPKKSYEIHLEDGSIRHWNAEYDDPSMIRNALSFEFFNRIGVLAPKTKHCWIEWNGQPIGVYLEIESVDRHFFRKRRVACRSIFYAVNDNANFGLSDPETGKKKSSLWEGYELMLGTRASQQRLVGFIRGLHRLSGGALRKHLTERLDIPIYLRWLAGAVLTGNYDGFEQNYTLYEGSSRSIYRMMPWDYEGTWGRNCYGRPCETDLVRIQGYNHLTRKLLAIPTYRKQYRQILKKLLESDFTEQALMPVVEAMHHSIATAITMDATRKWDYGVFSAEPEFIRAYIRERRLIVQEELERWSVSGVKKTQKIPILK
ncbi:CotH kinase family protein [Paenibacillus daejeonensis]|uniref:CotH kinase family protein n=1 Tax=Paenibacillus daejeonensis TaxID=135193 RepID=UPI0003A360BC|nr:CotH kinase family protein [Paenibacillus daejeonensis]